jgi:hypothetical protein
MKKLIVGPVGGEWEGCAIAEADYEESDAQGLKFESPPKGIDERRRRDPPTAVAAGQEPLLHSTQAVGKFSLTKP